MAADSWERSQPPKNKTSGRGRERSGFFLQIAEPTQTIFPFFFMSRQFLTFNGGQGHLLNPIHFGGERGDHVSILGWNLTFPSPTLLVNAQRGYLTIFSPAKLIVFRRKVFLSRIGAASEQIIIWFIRWVVTFHTSESRQCFRA